MNEEKGRSVLRWTDTTALHENTAAKSERVTKQKAADDTKTKRKLHTTLLAPISVDITLRKGEDRNNNDATSLPRDYIST